jgi:hypothetical protein
MVQKQQQQQQQQQGNRAEHSQCSGSNLILADC